ncbi:MAG: tRNA-dihydrouridine synthase family protein [Eubacterium sp.]|nr:tRNA-dihydrouridine synthase family protein [Eubacterium sp.]
MKLYFAPLDGVTGFIYRNAFAEFFGGPDKYFAPFISPCHNPKLKGREIKDLLPENNSKKVNLVPQIMANNAEYFVKGTRQIADMGYEEVNLNAGCPSGTVVPKGRGAGFLKDTYLMEKFFDEVFCKLDMKISVKTRIGIMDASELEEIMEVYNKFPFEEIIIHPRTRVQLYKGEPDMKAFDYAYQVSKNPLCFNGNIFTVEDYENIVSRYNIDSVMLGRGLLRNPNLVNEIKLKEEQQVKNFFVKNSIQYRANNKDRSVSKEIIRAFHDKLYADFSEEMSSDRHLLNKMIEMWNYLSFVSIDQHKCAKLIRKAQSVFKYEKAVNEIFDNLM